MNGVLETRSSKPVLLIIIDGMTCDVISPAVRRGELSFLAEVASAGRLDPCYSIFPSITPAATASIISGCAPRQHGVQGAFWYDENEKDIEYFGDCFWVAAAEGIGNYVEGFLKGLNDRLLRTPTLFELAASAGLRSADLNLMWRRGPRCHPVNAPWLMRLLPGVDFETEVMGPDWLFLGDFVKTPLAGIEGFRLPGGLTGKFGFNDEATAEQLKTLFASQAEPDLIVAYFPDNDYRSHQEGPEEALSRVKSTDAHLMQLAKHHGGVSKLLEQYAVVIVGDHAHDPLDDRRGPRAIDLAEVFANQEVTPAGKLWENEKQLLICPNMRAAQVNTHPEAQVSLADLAATALDCEFIDQAIWSNDGEEFHVATSKRGSVSFREAQSGDTSAESGKEIVTDNLGRSWSVSGDLGAIDARKNGQGSVSFGDYPLAMSRIKDGAPGCQPSLWLTAAPTCEFVLPSMKANRAGSHGSLHRSDSETVLLQAGLSSGCVEKASFSITDVVPICLQALGIESEVVASKA